MVILFKGTDRSKNLAPQALALAAGLSATKYYKKTLVLQLTTNYKVEEYIIGKRISEQSINDNLYLFDDTGIDSLTRRAGVTAFTEDHFQNAVMPTVSSENLFDILPISKKIESDFTREIIQDPSIISTIITSAQKIYDNVFILGNGKQPEVIEAILPFVDKTVTCVSQGAKEDISAKNSDTHYYLITSYDYKSSYSAKVMQKTYGAKKIFIMPYNVEFKDAYTQSNLLQYILHNNAPDASDYAFHLIDEMTKLIRALTDDIEPDDMEFRFSPKRVSRVFKALSGISGDEFVEEETPKKLFRPSRTKVHRVAGDYLKDDDFDDEEEYVPDEQELDGQDLTYEEIDEEIEEEYDNEAPEEDIEELEEEAPAKRGLFGKKKDKKAKKNKKSSKEEIEEYQEEELNEEEEEIEEEPAPAPKKKRKHAPKPETEVYEEEDEEEDVMFDAADYEEDEDDEYEPEPTPAPKKKASKPTYSEEDISQALELIEAGYTMMEVTLQTKIPKKVLEEAIASQEE